MLDEHSAAAAAARSAVKPSGKAALGSKTTPGFEEAVSRAAEECGNDVADAEAVDDAGASPTAASEVSLPAMPPGVAYRSRRSSMRTSFLAAARRTAPSNHCCLAVRGLAKAASTAAAMAGLFPFFAAAASAAARAAAVGSFCLVPTPPPKRLLSPPEAASELTARTAATDAIPAAMSMMPSGCQPWNLRKLPVPRGEYLDEDECFFSCSPEVEIVLFLKRKASEQAEKKEEKGAPLIPRARDRARRRLAEVGKERPGQLRVGAETQVEARVPCVGVGVGGVLGDGQRRRRRRHRRRRQRARLRRGLVHRSERHRRHEPTSVVVERRLVGLVRLARVEEPEEARGGSRARAALPSRDDVGPADESAEERRRVGVRRRVR